MFKRLIDFCLGNPWLTLGVTVIAVTLAVTTARRLPVDVFPELKVPRVVVQTEAGGQIEYGIIKPECSFDTLVQVFVIKSFEVVE